MAGERRVITLLERLMAVDLEDMQSIQSMLLGEVLCFLGAARRQSVQGRNNLIGAAPAGSVPLDLIGGLEVRDNGAGTAVTVSPGWLAIENPGNIVRGDYDSSYRVGMIRAAVDVAYPDTSALSLDADAEAYHLLSVRIHTTTTQDTVDIYNESTEEFDPTLSNHDVELDLEFQWTLGAAIGGDTSRVEMPALDTGSVSGWRPLAYVRYVTGGTENDGRNLDVAHRIQDAAMAGEITDPSTFVRTAFSPPAEYRARLSTLTSPNLGSAIQMFRGQMDGSVEGQRTHWRVDPHGQTASQNRLHATDGSANPTAADQLVNFFLVPLISGSLVRWPSAISTEFGVATNSEVMRGILVSSTTCHPTRDFKNDTAITLAEDEFAAFDEIPIGAAQYLGSGFSAASGAGGRKALRAAMQSWGGEFRLQTPIEVLEWTVDATTIKAAEMDLRDLVPHCASHVILKITQFTKEATTPADTDRTPVDYEVRQYVNDTANATLPLYGSSAFEHAGDVLANAALATSGETNGSSSVFGGEFNMTTELVVPVGWIPSLVHPDALSAQLDYHLRLALVRKLWMDSVPTGQQYANWVYLVGWKI
jgi:hypothetical protein